MIRSKTSFWLGFTSGLAVVALIGFVVFLGMYLKQQMGTSSGDNSDTVAAVDNTAPTKNNPAAGNDAGNAAAGKPVSIKIANSDHVRGNKNAKVTIVEFSDYQCPFCSRFHDTMKEVMQKYPKDVRWIFKHFPLDSIHPYARKAAEAAECAGEQNKFWEYSDAIYANQDKLNDEYIVSAGKDVGLNEAKFKSCLDSGKFTKKVDEDMSYGQSLGVQGTPGSFVNGQAIPGAVPFSEIEKLIKAALK